MLNSPTLKSLILCALTIVAYIPAMQAGFIWDDDQYVTENDNLRTADGLQQIWFHPIATAQYYPMVFSTFWLEYHVWELRPAGYHWANLLLHLANATLIWQLLARLQVPGAWLTALVFAVHPVHVESVAWITERKNVLSTFFYLAAFLAYWRPTAQFESSGAETSPPSSWRWYLSALTLFACAVFSKTVTCSLPATVLLVEWWKYGRVSTRSILRLLPYFLLGLGLGLHTAMLEKDHVGAEGDDFAFSAVQRCLIAGRAVWFYAAKLVWPSSLSFIYPRWQVDASEWQQYLFPIAAGVLLGVAWMLRNRFGRGPLAALLIFGGTLVPALGFFNVYPMLFSFVADHFQYLASVALLALLCGSAARVCEQLQLHKKWLPGAAAGVVVSCFTFLTWQQGHIYENQIKLWTDTLAKNPGCWLAHGNLGASIARGGTTAQGIAHLQEAIRINPRYPVFYQSLGQVFLSMQQRDAAIECLSKGIEIFPGHVDSRLALGQAYMETEQFDKAAAEFQAAIRLNPDLDTAHLGLGFAYRRMNRREAAATEFAAAVERNPGNVQARVDVIMALCKLDRPDEAAKFLTAELEKSNHGPRLQSTLGQAFEAVGNLPSALHHFRHLASLQPDGAGPRFRSGVVLLRMGQMKEAETEFIQGRRVQTEWPIAAAQVAWLLATHPRAELRHGALAVQLARQAADSARGQKAILYCLDVLAAAYAEAGKFDEATATASEALSIATTEREARAVAIKDRLQLYQSHRPFRDGTLDGP